MYVVLGLMHELSFSGGVGRGESDDVMQSDGETESISRIQRRTASTTDVTTLFDPSALVPGLLASLSGASGSFHVPHS